MYTFLKLSQNDFSDGQISEGPTCFQISYEYKIDLFFL